MVWDVRNRQMVNEMPGGMRGQISLTRIFEELGELREGEEVTHVELDGRGMVVFRIAQK